jgi:2',3'-cyclic-nucleotide 2'-phosphodiesterase (5'-nucleotidase family)
MLFVALLSCSLCAGRYITPSDKTATKLTILHTNDIHAHLDEFNKGGTGNNEIIKDCNDAAKKANACFGGIARMKTVIDAFRKNTTNVALLDAGDQFQGTLFFNYFNATPTAELMNALQYDAMTIGNHGNNNLTLEFDNGEAYLNTFINMLKFPVISSNMDLTHSMMARSNVQPYTIIKKYNLGVIGYITNTTGQISMNTKDITFNNPVPVVQKWINELHAKGIKRVIALSHNGYFQDKYLAENTRGLHLIVGGHSHSLLLKNTSVADVVGPYPTAVTGLDGKVTHVVQAHRYGDYLGHIDLEWDVSDNLVSLKGDPILLDQTISQDQTIQTKVQKLREHFLPLIKKTVAFSAAAFSSCGKTNYGKRHLMIECEMGELVAQCMLQDQSGLADFAWTNSGGIRAAFPAGNVSVAGMNQLT